MSFAVPTPLQPVLEQAWQPLYDAGLTPQTSLLAAWQKVLLGSENLREQCLRMPSLFAWLEEQAAIDVLQPSALEFDLQQQLAAADEIDTIKPVVRNMRHHSCFRVISRASEG